MEWFERPFPRRFHWQSNINWDTGHRNEFDQAKLDRWKIDLSPEQLDFVISDETSRRFMSSFGYEE